jgi:hypothetical protein
MMHPGGWGSWAFEVDSFDTGSGEMKFAKGGFQVRKRDSGSIVQCIVYECMKGGFQVRTRDSGSKCSHCALWRVIVDSLPPIL